MVRKGITMSISVQEKVYLQFQFGLFNRLIEHRIGDSWRECGFFSPGLVRAWGMGNGEKSLEELGALLRKAKALYRRFIKDERQAALEKIMQKEVRRYSDQDGNIKSHNYYLLTVYMSFFEFLLLGLLLLLDKQVSASSIIIQSNNLFSSSEQREWFHKETEFQRLAMNISEETLLNVLLQAGNADQPVVSKDEKKVSCISCVSDANAYKAMKESVKRQNLPQGYTLDFIPVYDADSMCAGYNQGMWSSDAKYKLYLHQDACLINQDVIVNMIEHFEKMPNVAMLGLAGSRHIPCSGVWWDDDTAYIQLQGGCQVGTARDKWNQAMVLDGFFLMTQYDMTWRDDVFSGWHFYDVSQSIEYQKKGYRVEFPRQEEGWCSHHEGSVRDVDEIFHYWREIFLQEYGSELE